MPKSLLRKLGKSFFIICNLAFSVLFILACYGSDINGGKYWITGMLTLASLYFLAALVFFLIAWLFVKPAISIISILTLIICWKPLNQLIGMRTIIPFASEKKAGDIRVMNWNVELFNLLHFRKHPEKKQEMIRTVRALNPDVICFQEMAASDFNSRAINYLPDIVKRLGDYQYYYFYNPDHDFDKAHRFGKIILSRYPIVNKASLTLNPKSYNASFIYVDILRGRDTIRIFNIHLQSLRFDQNNLKYLEDFSLNHDNQMENSKNILSKLKHGFIERKRQSDFIRQSMLNSPYPNILCGDFNDVPNSYAYKTIGRGMMNAFAEKGSWIGNTFDGISPTLRIDNIFCSPAFEIVQYDKVHKKLSDHFPIVADLRISGK